MSINVKQLRSQFVREQNHGMRGESTYSHSSGEVIDTKDLDAFGKIVAVSAKSWRWRQYAAFSTSGDGF